MFHLLYKTTSESGKYYVGRHSTKNINDNYFGSGKWIRSIKDKSSLKKEIIKTCDSFDELREEEQKLLQEVINDPLNMNFNNNSCGFSSGLLNPAYSEKERKRRKEQKWMKSEEGRRWASENNPSKKFEVKEKRRQKAQEQLLNGTHNFQRKDVQERKNASTSLRSKINNPMWNEETRIKVSEKLKTQYSKKVTCPHCSLEGNGPTMKRWHFQNCKNLKNLGFINTKHNRSNLNG